MKTLRLV